MNAAELKLDLINRIASLKESWIVEELKNILDFEQDESVYQLNEGQKNRIFYAQNDQSLTVEEADNEIAKWLEEK